MIVQYWAIGCAGLLVLLLVYLIGVRVGRVYERSKVIKVTQQLLRELLHKAAEHDYVSIHSMLQEALGEDEDDRDA